MALSHMALCDFDSAKEQFNQLKNSNAHFAKDCDWYLSLIYLKEGDHEKTISLLGTFTSGTYKERAAAIVAQLGKAN